METWQKIAMAIVPLLIIFMLLPGIKGSLQQSREAKKDWPGFLIPIALVILFVVFLLSTV